MNLDTSLFIENLVTGTASYLKEMGFDKVSHVDGGFASISQSDFKIV